MTTNLIPFLPTSSNPKAYMKLREIFSQLAYGELSQHILGEHELGVVSPERHGALVSHINLGLNALYKRFFLKEGRIDLGVQSGMTNYILNSEYAVSNVESSALVRYLLDTPEAPFMDDIHKLERVLTSEEVELPLNDEAESYACFTPSQTSLRIPIDIASPTSSTPDYLKTSQLTLVYRANHPPIQIVDGVVDTDMEVYLPASHLEALLYFVASRVNNPIGMTNEFHAGNSLAAKYEMECQKLEGFNLQIDNMSQHTEFEHRGWI